MSSSSPDAPFHFPQNVEWVDAAQCQRCGTSSWLPWKHHCRACGGCFCQKCSSQVLALPPQHPTPVRVCDDCYAKYSSRSAARPVVRVETGSGGHMSASLPVGFTARQLHEYDGSRTSSFDPMSASLRDFGVGDSPRATWLTNRPASYYSPVSPSPKPLDKEDEDEVEAIAEEEEKGAPQKEEKSAEESSGAQNKQQPLVDKKSPEEGHRNTPHPEAGNEEEQARRRDETESEAKSSTKAPAETEGSQVPEDEGVEDVSRRDENDENEPPVDTPNEGPKEDDQPSQAIAEPTAPVDEEKNDEQGEPVVEPTTEEIVPREQEESVAPDSGSRSSEPEGQETLEGAGDVNVQTTKPTRDASGTEAEAYSELPEQQQPSADPDTPLPTARGSAEEEKAEVIALKESIKLTEEEDKVEKEKMEAIQNRLRNMQSGTIHARVEVAILAAKELASSLFYGLRDALQLKRVTVSFKNSNRVYNRIWDTVILNGGLLLMMWLVFYYLLEPHFASALHFEEHRGFTLGAVHFLQSLFHYAFLVVYVIPIYVLSLVLNIQWSKEIGNGAFSLYTYIRRGRVLQKTSESLSDAIAQTIYWQVIFGVFNVLNFFCKFVPIVGPPFYFLCLCWLNAVYCFDYKWGNQMWSLQKKISYCETRWLYFVGFGLPITLATFFFEYIISYSLVSLLFPLFIPMAMFGSPKTQSLWKPIPMSRFLDSSIIAPLIRLASGVPWFVQSLQENVATIVRVLGLTALSLVTLGVSALLLFYLVF